MARPRITDKERHLARLMASDTAGYEQRATFVAAKLANRAYKPVMDGWRAWARGRGHLSILGHPDAFLARLRSLLAPAFDSVKDELADSMVIGHLLGIKREGQSASLSLSKQSRAVKILEDQLNMTPAQIKSIREQYDAQAFRVLANASDATERKLQQAVLEAIRNGDHVQEATAKLRQAFEDSGISPSNSYQLQTIFRTQMQMAYSGARWQADQEEAAQEILWGYKYVTVGDDRVRPTHAAMEGVTLPADDEFWNTRFPPNGWNCRCQALSIYEEREEVKPPETFTTTDDFDNEITVQPVADPGFGFNPGRVIAQLPITAQEIVPKPIKQEEEEAVSTPVVKTLAPEERTKLNEQWEAKAENIGEATELTRKQDATQHIATVLGQDEATKTSPDRKDWKFAYAFDSEGNLVAAGSIRLKAGRITSSGEDEAFIRNLGSIDKGGGRAVVEQLIDEARRAGLTKITLTSEEGAVGFYERLGFKMTDPATKFMELNLEPVQEVFHALTKGALEGGKVSTDIGTDFDIMGKGFYFGTKEYASHYGSPKKFEVVGRLATKEDWLATIQKFDDLPINERNKAAREELIKQGFVGVDQGGVGVVWVADAIRLITD